MTDETPRPPAPGSVPEAAAEAAPASGADPIEPAGRTTRRRWWNSVRVDRWQNRRVPLFVTGLTLLLGCLLGGALTAGVVAGFGGHNDERGHRNRAERADGRGDDDRGNRGDGRTRPDRRHGNRDDDATAPPTAPTSTAPTAPTSSAPSAAVGTAPASSAPAPASS